MGEYKIPLHYFLQLMKRMLDTYGEKEKKKKKIPTLHFFSFMEGAPLLVIPILSAGLAAPFFQSFS